MKKIIILLTIFNIQYSIFNSFAQDIHFSQFYVSPLTLNPANTGLFKGKYRGAVNYRSQWSSVIPNPYTTMSGSLDMVMKNKFANFGVGIMLFNDKSGAGALTINNIMVSFAAHKKFGKHQLSLGVQAGIVQKSIDYSELTFNNQYTSNAEFDPTSSSNENNVNTSFSYPDFEGGLLWLFTPSKQLNIYLGYATFHLTQPTETFYDATKNKLNSRSVFHGGGTYKLNKKIGVDPHFIFMSQSKAQEFLLGTDLSYHLGKASKADAILYVGAWYRDSFKNKTTDAFIPTVAGQYKNVRLGISYDVNVSSLKTASKAKGGFEISLIYILDVAKPLQMTVPCLRM